MIKLNHKIPITCLLVTVLGFAGFSVLAQLNNSESKNDDFDDNKNLVRIFRLVNSLNKEAEKQQANGFSKRADMLRNYFQKKTSISDNSKLKLNELAENFQKENESINNQIKEFRKNQENKPNDEAMDSGVKKLLESRNKLYDSSHKFLVNELNKDDLKNIVKFLNENMVGKTKNVNKFKNKEEFKNVIKPKWFNNISYNDSTFFEDEINGYSFIDYEPATGEVWGVAGTEGICEGGGEWDGQQDTECDTAIAYAELIYNGGEVLASDTIENSGSYADAYVYYAPVEDEGEYCISAQHIIVTNNDYQWLYAESNDCVDVDLSEGVNISSVEFEEINSAIDANPGNGQPSTNVGYRIFPDKESLTDTEDRSKVKVKATVSPARQGVKVYFRSFDLDDPSSDSTPIDTNGSLGNDNLGLVDGSSSGKIEDYDITDSNGEASVDFFVTKQPGDNFAVAASLDDSFLVNTTVDGIQLKNGSQMISTSPTSLAVRTDMLTVWRKLHIEINSMGASTQNWVLGSIATGLTVVSGQTVTIETSFTTPPGYFGVGIPDHQYQDGRLESNGNSFEGFKVKDNYSYSNSAGFKIGDKLVIENTSPNSITIPNNSQLILYDDDDFNDNDTNSLKGDTGEDIPEPDMNINKGLFLIKDGSDDPIPNNTVGANIFASAYVRTVHITPQDGDIHNNSYFQSDVLGDGEENRPMFVDYDLDDGNSDSDFWTAFVLAAYQHTSPHDLDPNDEPCPYPGVTVPCGIAGETDAVTNITGEGSGALIFLEVHRPREYNGYTTNPVSEKSLAHTLAHEITHLFSGEHGDGGIMGDAAGNEPSTLNDLLISKIRNIAHP